MKARVRSRMVQVRSLDKDRKIVYVKQCLDEPFRYNKSDEKFLEAVMNEDRPIEMIQRSDDPNNIRINLCTSLHKKRKD
jgi:hypothetical protein